MLGDVLWRETHGRDLGEPDRTRLQRLLSRQRRPRSQRRCGAARGKQAGKSQALHLVRALSGFNVASTTESGDKLKRFGPFSAQCRAGNVKILRGPWNEDLFRILEGFPDLAHDDEVDACSGALEMLNPDMKGYPIFELYRREAEKLQAEQHSKPQRPQPTYAPGSLEWHAEQEKLKGGDSCS